MITENEALIITDPCYIIKDQDKQKEYYEIPVFKNAIVESTNYGDWNATLFKVEDPATDLKQLDGAQMYPIGDFCADAGMVCLVKMKDVLKYNPSFLETQNPWTYTIVTKGSYRGKVQWEYIDCYEPTQSAAIIGRSVKDNEIIFIAKQTGV